MSEGKKSARHRLAVHGKSIAARDPGFANFFLHTVAATDEDDLDSLEPEAYEAILRHSHARLGQRAEGEHLINIWYPPSEGPARVQVIDILAVDMPFLVDSVLAAIRARGGTIRLISHPILPVDTATRPWTVLASGGGDTPRESFLQVHIDPITDEFLVAGLYDELNQVLVEVGRAVRGWRPMLERLRQLVTDYRTNASHVSPAVLAEALHFLAWLADHNFTFLGMREYRLVAHGSEQGRLEPVGGSGLGILEDPEYLFLRHGAGYVEMTDQHVAFLRHGDPLLVTKANTRSRVHRRGHMDYIGVKLHAADGALSGELRILGLFTSMSMTTPHTEVPILRRKIAEVMRRSGLEPRSHAGKALMAALATYPRDELFQISNDLLLEFVTIISLLPDRPCVRVLPRPDPFDNFVSILCYLPRERYTAELRAGIGDYLAGQYDGRVSAYYPQFPEGELVRVHFIIGRNGGRTPQPDRRQLEDEIALMSRSFGDRLVEAASDPGAIAAYADAFSDAYQSSYTDAEALSDIAAFRSLTDETMLAVRLDRSHEREGALSLRLYHRGTPIPLSDRVPMLENFGFRVIDEQTHTVRPRDGEERFLHDMIIRADAVDIDVEEAAPRIERAMLAVWGGEADNDAFNQLTLSAGLDWDGVVVLRAFGLYLKQVGLAYSRRYLAATLGRHPAIASAMLDLFRSLLDPGFEGSRENEAARLSAAVENALGEVSSLDEDRIVRHFLSVCHAALRTNFWQRDADGARRPALAIKFDSTRVEGLPDPRPFREIFVFSPRVEGIHLRGGAIARGGIRWSDRPEDFRTEILSLMKAQMVKNAVIVPVGAKGGFVPRQMAPGLDRDAVLAEGTACYRLFIGALLDVTDNLEGDTLLPPPETLRRDGDDPYLVVAADKGTASFSDLANSIARDRGFWLDDAFASGGSAGYDHKKMGITARGAWEAVRRHFRELNRDIQKEPFTVAGVGDMSGDVFGNGMLLSGQIRLVAAFDHRDIFIDPDPDPALSFAERKRLFALARSSWSDYDRKLLSAGGGVYPRSAKSIQLTPQMRTLLGMAGEATTPQALIRAILKAEVDLLWFGGIGTYVRATTESDAEAGDRANDAVRVTGADLRARVVGEGANLALTQRGRIEYAMAGGRINTDAIDNSAGVNSSDLEVNIKIALGSLARRGGLDQPSRDAFLVEMTGEVAGLCLRNNYLQTLALSLAARKGTAGFSDQAALMHKLEAEGRLNRGVEYLPDDHGIAERQASGTALTRPELAVLLAYAKTTLYTDLLASDVPDDPDLASELFRYFPDRLRQRFPETIENHRLRREVIATVLANAMINRGGIGYVEIMRAAGGHDPASIARAYAAARDAFDLPALNAMVDTLDNVIDGGTQLALYEEIQELLVSQTLWFLRNLDLAGGLAATVSRYRAGVTAVRERLGGSLPRALAEAVADRAVRYVNGGTPREIARRIAELPTLALGTEIVLVAEQCGAGIAEATEAYFTVMTAFGLGRIADRAADLNLSERFDLLARDRAMNGIAMAQRRLTIDVLAAAGGSIGTRLESWRTHRTAEVDRARTMLAELAEGDLTLSRLAVAQGLLADLVQS